MVALKERLIGAPPSIKTPFDLFASARARTLVCLCLSPKWSYHRELILLDRIDSVGQALVVTVIQNRCNVEGRRNAIKCNSNN